MFYCEQITAGITGRLQCHARGQFKLNGLHPCGLHTELRDPVLVYQVSEVTLKITEPKYEAFSSHTSIVIHSDTLLVFGQLKQLLMQFFNSP